MSQEDDETTAQFVTRYKQGAKDCDFEQKTEEFIRDQVVDKCRSDQLRTKFLAETNLTLQKVLTLAAAKELSEQQSSLMVSENAFLMKHTEQRKQVTHRSNTGSRPALKWGHCGRNGHSSDHCRCTKNVTCYTCSKVGHKVATLSTVMLQLY
ncbi:hypothetical protein Ahia01_000537200 [Argonauta hians]